MEGGGGLRRRCLREDLGEETVLSIVCPNGRVKEGGGEWDFKGVRGGEGVDGMVVVVAMGESLRAGVGIWLQNCWKILAGIQRILISYSLNLGKTRGNVGATATAFINIRPSLNRVPELRAIGRVNDFGYGKDFELTGRPALARRLKCPRYSPPRYKEGSSPAVKVSQ